MFVGISRAGPMVWFYVTVSRIDGLECYSSIDGVKITEAEPGAACASCFTFKGLYQGIHRTYIMYFTRVVIEYTLLSKKSEQ